jgi:Holliday junction resolvasome RuvABC endonuclease subunit
MGLKKKERVVCGIDPGNEESAYVVLNDSYKILEFGKVKNTELEEGLMDLIEGYNIDEVAIECIRSYGMGVGDTVFETCIWIGRFMHQLDTKGIKFTRIYRSDEKIHICGSMKAKDSNIRIALIDRFAKHDRKNGKGKKDNPDYFYGFHADVWQAFSTTITCLEDGYKKE